MVHIYATFNGKPHFSKEGYIKILHTHFGLEQDSKNLCFTQQESLLMKTEKAQLLPSRRHDRPCLIKTWNRFVLCPFVV